MHKQACDKFLRTLRPPTGGAWGGRPHREGHCHRCGARGYLGAGGPGGGGARTVKATAAAVGHGAVSRGSRRFDLGIFWPWLQKSTKWSPWN